MDNIIEALRKGVRTGRALIEGCAAASRELEPRRWKGKELLNLIGVKNVNNLRYAVENGKVPPPDCFAKDGGYTKWQYGLEGILAAQKHFKTHPGRQEAEDGPVTLSFTNFKGGCWKSTTAWYFVVWLASQGYRVWAIDLDPQGSLSRNLGFLPDWETTLEDTLALLLQKPDLVNPDSVQRVIQDTHLPNLKLTPSSLMMHYVESTLTRELVETNYKNYPGNTGAERELAQQADRIRILTRLSRIIGHVEGGFDIVVLDGTPALGQLPMNIVLASNVTVAPVPTEMADYCSTVAFTELLLDQYESYFKYFGDSFPVTDIRFLPTRFTPGKLKTNEDNVGDGTADAPQVGGDEGRVKSSDAAAQDKKRRRDPLTSSQYILDRFIRPTWGDRVLNSVIQQHAAAVGRLGPLSRTVFDVNAGMGNVKKDSRMRAMANYEESFAEIMEKLVFPRWPSKVKKRKLQEKLESA